MKYLIRYDPGFICFEDELTEKVYKHLSSPAFRLWEELRDRMGEEVELTHENFLKKFSEEIYRKAVKELIKKKYIINDLVFMLPVDILTETIDKIGRESARMINKIDI